MKSGCDIVNSFSGNALKSLPVMIKSREEKEGIKGGFSFRLVVAGLEKIRQRMKEQV